jgi:hypothetical protein
MGCSLINRVEAIFLERGEVRFAHLAGGDANHGILGSSASLPQCSFLARRFAFLVSRSREIKDRRLALLCLRIQTCHQKNLSRDFGADWQADQFFSGFHGDWKSWVQMPLARRWATSLAFAASPHTTRDGADKSIRRMPDTKYPDLGNPTGSREV